MKPKPWSHSALEAFKNCPRQYHAERVEKSVPYVEGPEAKYGNMVHKAFELRVKDGKPLPAELQEHEGYLAKLAALPGKIMVEVPIAIDRELKPCGYWDNDRVWYRSKIDYLNIHEGRARIVDYKTGKSHQKILQLFEYMLFAMIALPEIQIAYAEYYWTKYQSITGTGGSWPRDRIMDETWPMLLPDLKQFAEAFKTDTWQPRQSGLCKRHCPVTACEFNGEYRA